VVTTTDLERFGADGYLLVKGLFPPDEVAQLLEHYMRLRAAGTYPGDTAGVDAGSGDPLKRYPRMIHMHRWDATSLRWMIDPRMNACMTALLGREPLAVQTMLYFKPPGARGQALHQDQYYLRVQPGTCIAAWLALDACDEENGCLQVVPGSGDLPVLCARKADTRVSFTDVEVPLPDGVSSAPVRMDAGDVLFFNGSLVHGSYPNTTKDRFRRALIGHYVPGNAEQVSSFYHPVLRMDGTPVEIGLSEGNDPCGIWVEQDGTPVVTLQGGDEGRGTGDVGRGT
jgi:phytanoyl-CoA hydroxylase